MAEEQEDQKKPDRIGLLTIIFMPMVAILFDLLSVFIPFIGALGWIVFALWFFMIGVGPFTMRRIITMLCSILVELIPLVAIIPSVTLGVIVIIVMVKLEDKVGIKLPLKT